MNAAPASTATLTRAEKLLTSLLAALDAERAAVVRLDGEALERVREEKERITAELTAVDPLRMSSDLDRRRVANVRAMASRVVNAARANAILLVDASELIAARAGIERQPRATTYDARARIRGAARSIYARGA